MTGRERLKVLHDFLKTNRNIINGHFHLDDWTDSENSEGLLEDALECGTVCCAVGWGTYCKELQEEGLQMYMLLASAGCRAWSCIEAFFNISEEDTCQLFHKMTYKDDEHDSIDAVINRLAEFLHLSKSARLYR